MTDRTYYIVEADTILKGRRIRVIEDTSDVFTEAQCVAFVSRCENVQRVIEVNVEDRTARDISEDVARALIRYDSGIELTAGDREFIETQLGCQVAARAFGN